MLTIGNFIYHRIADFSTDPDLLLKWGRKRLITEDIYGNYIVYWKERFPLFDAFDRESEDRHYRVIVFCNSLSEAQTKLSLLQKEEKSITQFGGNNESIRCFGISLPNYCPMYIVKISKNWCWLSVMPYIDNKSIPQPCKNSSKN